MDFRHLHSSEESYVLTFRNANSCELGLKEIWWITGSSQKVFASIWMICKFIFSFSEINQLSFPLSFFCRVFKFFKSLTFQSVFFPNTFFYLYKLQTNCRYRTVFLWLLEEVHESFRFDSPRFHKFVHYYQKSQERMLSKMTFKEDEFLISVSLFKSFDIHIYYLLRISIICNGVDSYSIRNTYEVISFRLEIISVLFNEQYL